MTEGEPRTSVHRTEEGSPWVTPPRPSTVPSSPAPIPPRRPWPRSRRTCRSCGGTSARGSRQTDADGQGAGTEQPRRRDRRGGSVGHPDAGAAEPAAGAVRGRGRRRAAGDRGQEPADGADDRHGLLRHLHAGRHPAAGAGEPGLVHRVHALPARDQPRTPRGAAELPDHGRGPHRAAHGERVAARRGHRGGRGHDAGGALGQGIAHCRRRRGHLPADDRRAADPGAPARDHHRGA